MQIGRKMTELEALEVLSVVLEHPVPLFIYFLLNLEPDTSSCYRVPLALVSSNVVLLFHWTCFQLCAQK